MKKLAHIRYLLFGMFLRYLPFVIQQGKLYSAVPPLYGAKVDKKIKFFADNIDYIEYVQNVFCKNNSICNLKNKPYTKKEITNILYKNNYYVKEIDKVSSDFSIDPLFLEYILYNKGTPKNKLKSVLSKFSKYVEIHENNGVTIVKALVNNEIQTVFFADRFYNACNSIIEMIDKSEEYFMINGKKSSIYELMKLFSSFEPSNITRYKGLGEMKPSDLGISTVLPDMGRTLKQYTISDVQKELKYFTELQSDKSVFIKGIKIRKEDIV